MSLNSTTVAGGFRNNFLFTMGTAFVGVGTLTGCIKSAIIGYVLGVGFLTLIHHFWK